MAKKKSSLSLWIMLAAIVALAAVIFLLPSCGASGTEKSTLAKVGTEAPDFTVEMVGGEPIHLADLRGKVVLLNFWATWCSPCCLELRRVQTEVIDHFAGREFVFLPISRGETRAEVEAFRTEEGYSFPMGLDPQELIYNLYANNYVPRNFIIGKDGRIVKYTVGYTPGEFAELIHLIDTELQK
ncbi:MAG: TlpA disulfide reductase family protein [Alistipes sp.]